MSSNAANYVVLARKYRSRTFAELIGQEALVKTLSNAIAAGKIHHAYVLTGIRGTGKTSTARLLSMALNCEDGPSTTWNDDDPQVKAIRAGTHPDVLEYDAASNRGVEEVEKLFEGVAYAPVMGRYKVYIIDEVHMLSTTAFNALLKTLEEPPSWVKFIFATTEVHKIPVTVLSRCQRFDLRRIPVDVLTSHFTSILDKEGLSAEPSAITAIATAADGSVRDGLSLLDQAIALSHGGTVQAQTVQEMLGLADQGKLLSLLEKVLGGETQPALAMLDDLYTNGQDASLVVQGLLELTHLLTRIKLVKGLAEGGTLTELETTVAVPLAHKVNLVGLNRVYQMLFQAAAEVREATRPYEALSMATVRITHLAPLPPLADILKNGLPAVPTQPAGHSAGAALATPSAPPAFVPAAAPLRPPSAPTPLPAAPQPSTPITGWADVVKRVEAQKPALAAALKQQVRCHGLHGTHLRLSIDRGLHDARDLLRDIRLALNESTGDNWDVAMATDEAPAPVATLAEEAKAEYASKKEAAKSDPAVQSILQAYPGAELEALEIDETTH